MIELQLVGGNKIAVKPELIDRVSQDKDKCHIIYMGFKYDLNHSFEYVMSKIRNTRNPSGPNLNNNFQDIFDTLTRDFAKAWQADRNNFGT